VPTTWATTTTTFVLAPTARSHGGGAGCLHLRTAGQAVEQINNTTRTVEYLHHDQQGSTRLLTGSTGTLTGKCTYTAYGTPTCEGTATTPLGYDGQYTSTDTGLIYMRARVYDPATAQFLTRDPWVAITGEPYSYVGDNPLTFADPHRPLQRLVRRGHRRRRRLSRNWCR
jgi:RHS repeat-associated protein